MTHKRIYQIVSQSSQGTQAPSEVQWYFKVRGDRTRGPFISYDAAEQDLNTFIIDCKKRTRLRIDWSNLFTGWSSKHSVSDSR